MYFPTIVLRETSGVSDAYLESVDFQVPGGGFLPSSYVRKRLPRRFDSFGRA